MSNAAPPVAGTAVPTQVVTSQFPDKTILPNGTQVGQLTWSLLDQDFNPELPVATAHQNIGLAFVCIFNALTLILIVTRVTYRRTRLGRFRKDDVWIMVAGVILCFPYWASQIATIKYGSGLHVQNVPDSWLRPFFYWAIGWCGYYIVASMIKVSVLYGFLEMLPPAFHKMRLCVYILSALICGLGIAESGVWIFQCLPLESNFDYDAESYYCADVDMARYAWVGISVLFDFCIVAIPFAIIRQIRLKPHERMVVLGVFAANLLGTAACALGAYGIWSNNNTFSSSDEPYTETAFVSITDAEIFLYTVGASATMGSRFFISKVESLTQGQGKTTTARDWRSEISWPTSNESYYTHTTPTKVRSPSSPRGGFGSFGLKRGFKGSDVEILEGFDMMESPRSYSSTPRSGKGMWEKQSPPTSTAQHSISRPMLQASPDPGRGGNGTPILQDLSNLAAGAPAPGARGMPRSNGRSPQNVGIPFTPVNWNQGPRAPTPPELARMQPWEGNGPIDGYHRV